MLSQSDVAPRQQTTYLVRKRTCPSYQPATLRCITFRALFLCACILMLQVGTSIFPPFATSMGMLLTSIRIPFIYNHGGAVTGVAHANAPSKLKYDRGVAILLVQSSEHSAI